MNTDLPAYGLWSLVILNSAIFLIFAFSFFKPQTARDWRTFGLKKLNANIRKMAELRMTSDHSP